MRQLTSRRPLASPAQAQAFARLPEQTRRDRHELLQEAVDLLFDKYHRQAYGPKP